MGRIGNFFKKIFRRNEGENLLEDGNNNDTSSNNSTDNLKLNLDELLSAEPTYDNIRKAIEIFNRETTEMFAYSTSADIIELSFDSQEVKKICECSKTLSELASTMFISMVSGKIKSDEDILHAASTLKRAMPILKKTREGLDKIKGETSRAEEFRQNKFVPEEDRTTTESPEMSNGTTAQIRNGGYPGWDVDDI